MGRVGLVPTSTATKPSFQPVLPGAEISGQFIVPSFSGSTFTITLVRDIGQITTVLLNGQAYRYSLKATPTAGTYRYNPTTAALTIAPLSGAAAGMVGLLRGLPGGGPVAGFAATVRTEWDEPVDPLLARWNIFGDVSVSRSFRAHPTCSFSFQNYENNRALIRSEWKNGTTTWLLRGIRFRQTSIEITRNKGDQRGALTVTISGTGVHAKPLETSIPYNVPAGSSTLQTTAETLCRAAGTAYRGLSITIPVPSDVKATDRTTAGEWIEARDRSVAGYAYYSNPDAVEVRPWGSPKLHFLSDSELTDNFPDFSTSADGADFEDVQLGEEFKNRPWEPDREDGQDDEDSASLERGSEVVLYSVSRVRPNRPPAGVDLRDANLSWPNGPTAVEKWTHLKNGEIVKERERTWAFLYTAAQVYTVFTTPEYQDVYRGVNTQAYWRVCKKTTMTRKVRNDGYLIEEPITGWEFARFLEEDTLALRKAYYESTDQDERYKLALKMYLSCYAIAGPGAFLSTAPVFPYTPNPSFRRQIRQTKTYELAKLRDEYADVEVGEDGIEPMYATNIIDEETSRYSSANPDSTAENPLPDLVVGRNFISEIEVKILSKRPGREKFQQKTTVINSEGPEYLKGARQISTEEREGRPGTAQRLNLKLNNPAVIPGDPNPDEIQGKAYLINTPGSGLGPNDERGDSLSFDGVVSPEAAAAAAKVEADLANSQAYPTTLTYAPNRRLQEGDVVVAIDTPYRVLGIDEGFRILGPGTKPNTMQVQAPNGFTANVGRAFDIDLTVYEVEA